MLFLTAVLIGAAVGLINGIATESARNAEAAAASAEAQRAQAETAARRTALTEIQDRQVADLEADLERQQRQSGFDIETQRIAARRELSSTQAAFGASGVGGASRVAVTEQLSADFDRAIGEMEGRRTEAAEDARRAIEVARLQGAENIRQFESEEARLGAEIDVLDQEATGGFFGFDWGDVGNIGVSTLTGGLGGASAALPSLFPNTGTGTPATPVASGTESLGYFPRISTRPYGRPGTI